MSVPQRVNTYICETGGYAVCDGCIQEALQLPQRQQVQQITSTLGTTRDFKREHGECSICHNMAKVTRMKG
jgi:hypothetical protein